MNKQKFGNKKVASTKFKGKFDKQKLKHAKEMTHAGAPAAAPGRGAHKARRNQAPRAARARPRSRPAPAVVSATRTSMNGNEEDRERSRGGSSRDKKRQIFELNYVFGSTD